jgi:DnaJ-class molecular chaperone
MIYSFEECSLCDGRGHINGACKVCDGMGRVAVRQPPERCEKCSGTGYYCGFVYGSYSGLCPSCRGSGWKNTAYPTKA